MIKDYQAPGVNVRTEKINSETASAETQFDVVFIGQGISTRNKQVEKAGLKADVEDFPLVKIPFDITTDMNMDNFNKTGFKVGQITVTKSSVADGAPSEVTMEAGKDFEIVQNVTYSSGTGTTSITIKILTEQVTKSDVIYEVNFTMSMPDVEFDIKHMGAEDRLYNDSLFGPVVLEEGDNEFYNDIAIAAEIAYRMGLPRYAYLEVPRDYGSEATVADWKNTIKKIYYNRDAYRLVPLTNNQEIHQFIANSITDMSNPMDQRETTGFVTMDTDEIDDIYSLDELIDKVGGYSVQLNNNRVMNVFGAKEIHMTMNGTSYAISDYFLSVAVACYDRMAGMVMPISSGEITVFDKFVGPRFRPAEWNKLAKYGVCILTQDGPQDPVVIRHQLTTSQSDREDDQEFSVVKNYDAVVKKIRDRFRPFAGRYNSDTGYLEILDATMTTTISEIYELKLARSLTVTTGWQQGGTNKQTRLGTILKMEPVYPANVLEIKLLI